MKHQYEVQETRTEAMSWKMIIDQTKHQPAEYLGEIKDEVLERRYQKPMVPLKCKHHIPSISAPKDVTRNWEATASTD
jgi:hypothetical protein